MRHFASPKFWTSYEALPLQVRRLADANFALLKRDPQHPSLQFKKVGRYWSVRVGLRYRALAREVDNGYLWFWIGSRSNDRLSAALPIRATHPACFPPFYCRVSRSKSRTRINFENESAGVARLS